MATDCDPDDMEKAAFHEAGHAVVAWSLCLTVGHVELHVANNSGHARIADAEDALHRVAVSYAEFEVEDMFKGPTAFVRSEDDFTRADEELTKELRQQFKKSLYSPEGRALQIACRTWLTARLLTRWATSSSGSALERCRRALDRRRWIGGTGLCRLPSVLWLPC
jgi:hypothetical protein